MTESREEALEGRSPGPQPGDEPGTKRLAPPAIFRCRALSCQWPEKPCMLDDYPATESDEMPPFWAVKDCATLDVL